MSTNDRDSIRQTARAHRWVISTIDERRESYSRGMVEIMATYDRLRSLRDAWLSNLAVRWHPIENPTTDSVQALLGLPEHPEEH